MKYTIIPLLSLLLLSTPAVAKIATTTTVHCVDGYKYVIVTWIYGSIGGVSTTQMMKKGDRVDYPPQPIKCMKQIRNRL